MNTGFQVTSDSFSLRALQQIYERSLDRWCSLRTARRVEGVPIRPNGFYLCRLIDELEADERMALYLYFERNRPFKLLAYDMSSHGTAWNRVHSGLSKLQKALLERK